MKKEKYYYNPKSLKFEKIESSAGSILVNALIFLGSSIIFGGIIAYFIFTYFPSPQERKIKNELAMMEKQYKLTEQQLENMSIALESLREKDNHIYRVIFEKDPIPDAAWEGYVGGTERYKELKYYSNYELMKSLVEKVDKINHQIDIQSGSYNQIMRLCDEKARMLSSIPSIQPLAEKDLTRIASGFGMRKDPVYKIPKFHKGMDFSAPTGTPIYATGDGVIVTMAYSRRGYGNQIMIDHGYGYKTRYAHMSKFNVRKGDKIKRGQIIGFVGNTGKSLGPHLHYEVIKEDRALNPVYYYYNDLNEEQFERMLVSSQAAGQSMD